MPKKYIDSVKILYPKSKEKVLKKIEEWKKKLIEQYNCNLIVLFGSYAKNNYSYRSDLDLFLVHDDANLSFEKALGLAVEISTEIDWQIHIYDLEQYKKGMKNNNPFFKTILSEGIVIYENVPV